MSTMTGTARVPNGMADVVKSALNVLRTFEVQADAFNATVQAGDDGNVDALLVAKRPEHSRFAELNDLYGKVVLLETEIDQDNRKDLVLPTTEEVETAKNALTALKEQSKSIIGMVMDHGSDTDKDMIPAILVIKRGRPAGSSGNGGHGNVGQRKPRLSKASVFKDGQEVWSGSSEAGNPNDKATFANVARVITHDSGATVGIEQVKRGAYTAASLDITKDDLNTVAGDITYEVTADKVTYVVTVTPKPSAN